MLDSIKAWFKQPYSQDMSVWGWALFLLMLIVISAAWSHLLQSHINVNNAAV